MLDGITALGLVADRPEQVLSSVEFEFFDTALLGIDYSVQVREPEAGENDETEIAVQVMDGRRPVLEALLGFRKGSPAKWTPGAAHADATHPRELTSSELPVGHRSTGKYGPAEAEFSQLRSHLGMNKSWLAPQQVAALLWASYLIGMEMPGKRALFSRLRMEFEDVRAVSAPFDYETEIRAVSAVGELTIAGTLSSAGEVWARVELAAHVREDVPAITVASVEKVVGRSQSLAGKVALVTGASRGLGSAIAYALALQGCNVVVNFARNREAAEKLRDSLSSATSKILLDQGDAGSLEWCKQAAARVTEQFRRLDFLICNASPPLLPLWLEPDSAERVSDFLNSSLAMISFPLMSFLPLLAENKGWNVLISSVAATQPHPHFPHYSTAKCAAEALVRSAATEYRTMSSLIVRPARLLTDLTNTPLGRKGAMPPETVAAAILRRLQRESAMGKVEILDQF